MFNILFNKLESKDRGDGFNSYLGNADLRDKDGNKKGNVTIEILKGRFENENLVCYSVSKDEYNYMKAIFADFDCENEVD